MIEIKYKNKIYSVKFIYENVKDCLEDSSYSKENK